ncbi:hypothetical protein H2248_003104 [Termitomyces sp. 'cryptogamus']|nr:hypothetical protein H2248_003104 [Termitomyces sp. 'cryptogamus']
MNASNASLDLIQVLALGGASRDIEARFNIAAIILGGHHHMSWALGVLYNACGAWLTRRINEADLSAYLYRNGSLLVDAKLHSSAGFYQG